MAQGVDIRVVLPEEVVPDILLRSALSTVSRVSWRSDCRSPVGLPSRWVVRAVGIKVSLMLRICP